MSNPDETGATKPSMSDAAAAPWGIPTGVWALGFVSLLMDTSSEMIHVLLPVYMVAVLGTSTLAVGIIEGIAEATASITKVFSGALSDWLGRRKSLAALGYGLAAFTKPIFLLSVSLDWLVTARFIDRVGKGIRGFKQTVSGEDDDDKPTLASETSESAKSEEKKKVDS